MFSLSRPSKCTFQERELITALGSMIVLCVGVPIILRVAKYICIQEEDFGLRQIYGAL